MALNLLAHVIELVFGPVFLVVHLPELPAVVEDGIQILNLLAAGDLDAVVQGLTDGRFAVGTRALSSLIGTVLWVVLVASLLGEFGEMTELGGLAELLELFE